MRRKVSTHIASTYTWLGVAAGDNAGNRQGMVLRGALDRPSPFCFF